MLPLLYSFYCPNDCDRKVGVPEPIPCAPQNCSDDFNTEDPTDPYGQLFGPMFMWAPTCPTCGSTDTDPFANTSGKQYHCWTCGHVW